MSRAARNMREKRISMLIFPQGGHTPDGELKPFKEGVAYIAIKAEVLILPVAIAGLGRWFRSIPETSRRVK
jgi:1-acyl-sn-glycerol-3-phosphate acyltransferase